MRARSSSSRSAADDLVADPSGPPLTRISVGAENASRDAASRPTQTHDRLRTRQTLSDARQPLRTAHEMLTTMGAEAFAERARRELAATGETAASAASRPATS